MPCERQRRRHRRICLFELSVHYIPFCLSHNRFDSELDSQHHMRSLRGNQQKTNRFQVWYRMKMGCFFYPLFRILYLYEHEVLVHVIQFWRYPIHVLHSVPPLRPCDTMIGLYSQSHHNTKCVWGSNYFGCFSMICKPSFSVYNTKNIPNSYKIRLNVPKVEITQNEHGQCACVCVCIPTSTFWHSLAYVVLL